MKKILIIDDEEAILAAIDSILTDMGYEVTVCAEASAGEQEALEKNFELILVDIMMPGKNGAEIVETVLNEKPEANILIITGYPSDPLVKQALRAGARGVVKKPFEIGVILDFLNRQEQHE